MAKDTDIPSLQSLEKPEKLQDLLKEDRGDDCLSCRIVGESCFILVLDCYLKNNNKHRRRRLLGSRGIQLLLWTGTAPAAKGKNPS